MRVVAPGKVLLGGAYAVLEGAPAIVMAVDRYAVADTSRHAAQPSREVQAALGAERAPEVLGRDLCRNTGQKLGLGSSAATLVASLGALRALRGDDLRHPDVRRELFESARAAHAMAQSGGSGVDVAASVYGGIQRYEVPREGPPRTTAVRLPEGTHVAVFWTGASARTTDLRAKVEALRGRAPRVYDTCLDALKTTAHALSSAVAAGLVSDLIAAARAAEDGLAALGRAADAPIVLPTVERLAQIAHAEGASLSPSGAGGGDITVFLGAAPPSADLLSAACAAGLEDLSLSLDRGGVRIDNGLSKD